MWKSAGIDLDKQPGIHVVNLACGCAIKRFVLAKYDPITQITCIDCEPVLKVAQSLVGRLGIATQVDYLFSDLREIKLEQEQYNSAVLGQIAWFFTLSQNKDLFARVHHSLKIGGVLVIDSLTRSLQYDERETHVQFHLLRERRSALRS